MIALGKCNMISLNVRGLRNHIKRRSISVFFFTRSKLRCIFLRETYSEPNDENIWKSEWGGHMFFSHGSIHSRGVCILMSPSLNCTTKNIHKDQIGRIIWIDLRLINAKNLSFRNVYAPNDLRQQQEFIHSLNTYSMHNTDVKNLRIGGDWNFSLHAIDKKGGNPWKPTVSRDLLMTMMREFDLVDFTEREIQKIKATPTSQKRLNFVCALTFLSAICICKLQTMQGCSNFDHYFMQYICETF